MVSDQFKECKCSAYLLCWTSVAAHSRTVSPVSILTCYLKAPGILVIWLLVIWRNQEYSLGVALVPSWTMVTYIKQNKNTVNTVTNLIYSWSLATSGGSTFQLYRTINQLFCRNMNTVYKKDYAWKIIVEIVTFSWMQNTNTAGTVGANKIAGTEDPPPPI